MNLDEVPCVPVRFHNTDVLPHSLSDLHMSGVYGWENQAMIRVGPKRKPQPTLSSSKPPTVHGFNNNVGLFSTSLVLVRLSTCALTSATPLTRSATCNIFWITWTRQILRNCKLPSASPASTKLCLIIHYNYSAVAKLSKPFNLLERTEKGNCFVAVVCLETRTGATASTC